MPFGPYDDFADCVSKNQGKDSPEAFCAAVHKQITGKFPTENEEPKQLSEKDQAFVELYQDGSDFEIVMKLEKILGDFLLGLLTPKDALSQAIMGGASGQQIKVMEDKVGAKATDFWNAEFAAHAIIGIEAFKPGTHTDSVGTEHEWTVEDIQKMKAAFEAGVPPTVSVKLGHTSDEFNAKVAEELGIPALALTGDNAGDGAAKLGEVVAIRIAGDGTMMLDLSVTDEKMADLVEREFFTGVSVEISDQRVQDGKTWGPVLSGVALLGAQRPAIPGMAPLQTATIMDDGSKPDHIYCSACHPFTASTDYKEGSLTVPPDEATDSKGGDKNKLWDVTVADATRGRNIQATVSAPSEVSAKVIALRTIENFLLNATGPLGSIVGTALGAVIVARLAFGKIIPSKKGILGLLKWKFEEPVYVLGEFVGLLPVTVMNQIMNVWALFEKGEIEREEAVKRIDKVVRRVEGQVSTGTFQKLLLALQAVKAGLIGRQLPSGLPQLGEQESLVILDSAIDQFETALRQLPLDSKHVARVHSLVSELKEAIMTQHDLAQHPPEGVSQDAWASCLSQAASDGVENPEAHCREQLMEEPEMDKQLRSILGLKESAPSTEVVAAIQTLKGQENGNFKEVSDEVAKLKEYNATLQREKRLHEFMDATAKLGSMAGTAKELAERLVTIDEAAGSEHADALLVEWQTLDKLYKDNGLLTLKLSNTESNEPKHEFEERVTALAKEKDITEQVALAQLSTSDPTAFAEYRNSNRNGG